LLVLYLLGLPVISLAQRDRPFRLGLAKQRLLKGRVLYGALCGVLYGVLYGALPDSLGFCQGAILCDFKVLHSVQRGLRVPL
jgi:hypothetical protein